ncbi:MAG: hypothetical protein MMC23_007268 [Stictis urceolatum]|nr:hypothetical protein [Stictis urceolata]
MFSPEAIPAVKTMHAIDPARVSQDWCFWQIPSFHRPGSGHFNMTRSHKFTDRDHAGIADGTAQPEEHLPRFFAKSGFVDQDPKKIKKEGGGKGNWWVPQSLQSDIQCLYTFTISTILDLSNLVPMYIFPHHSRSHLHSFQTYTPALTHKRGHPGAEAADCGYNMSNPRRRSNSSTHVDFKTKFEAVETDPVFEEETMGPLEKEDTIDSSSGGSVDEEDAAPAKH